MMPRRSSEIRQNSDSCGCWHQILPIQFCTRRISAIWDLISCIALPRWRNWQTRMIQVHVSVMDVEVRLLSGAFQKHGLRTVFFYALTAEHWLLLAKMTFPRVAFSSVARPPARLRFRSGLIELLKMMISHLSIVVVLYFEAVADVV